MTVSTTAVKVCPVCGEHLPIPTLATPEVVIGGPAVDRTLGLAPGTTLMQDVLRRAAVHERQLHDHLAAHPPEEWLPKLMGAIGYAGKLMDFLNDMGEDYSEAPDWWPL